MKYAKYVSDSEITFPVPEDLESDGITLKKPEDWMEFKDSSEPSDTSPLKFYRYSYVLLGTRFASKKMIVKAWTPELK